MNEADRTAVECARCGRSAAHTNEAEIETRAAARGWPAP